MDQVDLQTTFVTSHVDTCHSCQSTRFTHSTHFDCFVGNFRSDCSPRFHTAVRTGTTTQDSGPQLGLTNIADACCRRRRSSVKGYFLSSHNDTKNERQESPVCAKEHTSKWCYGPARGFSEPFWWLSHVGERPKSVAAFNALQRTVQMAPSSRTAETSRDRHIDK